MLQLQKFRTIFNEKFSKNLSLENLRKLSFILAFSNIITASMFLIWYSNVLESWILEKFLYLFIFMNSCIGLFFLKNAVSFEGSKWLFWANISLIFISPLGGIFLFYYSSMPGYWKIKEKIAVNNVENKTEKVEILDNSKKQLEKKWSSAVEAIKNIDAIVYKKLTELVLKVPDQNFNNWSIFQISTIIAIANNLKQFKQKTFENFVWHPHWYENKYFTFAIKNKKLISSNNKYSYAIAVIVLDELNNQEKIFELKKEIKNNLCFSSSKIISFQKGLDYKIYVNQ